MEFLTDINILHLIRKYFKAFHFNEHIKHNHDAKNVRELL